MDRMHRFFGIRFALLSVSLRMTKGLGRGYKETAKLEMQKSQPLSARMTEGRGYGFEQQRCFKSKKS